MMKTLTAILVSLVMAFAPLSGHTGAFMFTDEANPGRIIHPSGYDGTGGVLHVEVCIDADAADATDIVTPVLNILKTINGMAAAAPNLIFGGANNVPPGDLDFESLTLHELGHCIGLGHPNMGSRPPPLDLTSVEENFTAAEDGPDDAFDFGLGADSKPGSSDDERDDDVNLHWFEVDVNNPFVEVVSPDASNYSRDLAHLPTGHTFPANAGRDVGPDLGFSNTEAVMQQGQYSDEDQRKLQADDIATLKFAMAGFDETSGNADDYTINMVYGGIRGDTSDCDIAIESDDSGFGYCLVGAFPHGNDHYVITSGTFVYNSEMDNWFFNPVADTTCSVGDNDLVISSATHNDRLYHQACNSITYGPGYTVGASGDVTAIAPAITLGPNTTINGEFAAVIAIP